MTMAAVDNDSNSGRRQRWTMKAADDDGTRDQAADYKGGGGEQAANNSGIRRAGQRAWNKNKEIEFTQKDFYQGYGLSGWSFCSRQKPTIFLLDLSVLSVAAMIVMKLRESDVSHNNIFLLLGSPFAIKPQVGGFLKALEYHRR
jgi:hypothetical protein